MGGVNTKIVYNQKYKEDGQNCSAIYRSPMSLQKLIQTPYQGCVTMRDILLRSVKQNSKINCLGKIMSRVNQQGKQERFISHLSYAQCLKQAQYIGSGLLNLNLCSQAEDLTFVKSGRMNFVGIYSKNRIEWGLIDVACILYGITSVPLYDTLGLQNLTYCLDQTNMSTLFCSGQTAQNLANLKSHGKLQTVILFEAPSTQSLEKLSKLFKVIYMQQLIQNGQKKPADFTKIDILPDDCSTFSYTSGTTGPPKGAMLSHKNYTSMIASLNTLQDCHLTQKDRHLSFLPLPHSFERGVFYCGLAIGLSITFYSGDMTKIKEDAQLVKPTIFCGVPRLYNKIAEGVQKKFLETGFIVRHLIHWAVQSKKHQMEKTGDFESPLYDNTIFKQTRAAFGGQVRLMITGSAPIKSQVQQFMKAIMAAPLIEGYGQTQHAAGGFVQHAKDPTLGHVGGVVTGLQFKLFDIPQMHYLHTDKNQKGQQTPRGQIWFRGPQVFLGYYKQAQKTKQTITEDGWLKTGDVGVILSQNMGVKIIDRKKNIFKLAQGQYIASEKVETVYSICPCVSEVYLHGESTHNFAVAIVSLKQHATMDFAKQHKFEGTFEQLCKNKEFRIALCKQLDRYGKQQGLMSFQQAKNIWLEAKSFQDVGITTNTMKLQRFMAKKHYAKQIETMYNEGPLIIKQNK